MGPSRTVPKLPNPEISKIIRSINKIKIRIIYFSVDFKNGLPLIIPETADCAFSRSPASHANVPDTVESGPQLKAPTKKRNTKLNSRPHELVI